MKGRRMDAVGLTGGECASADVEKRRVLKSAGNAWDRRCTGRAPGCGHAYKEAAAARRPRRRFQFPTPLLVAGPGRGGR